MILDSPLVQEFFRQAQSRIIESWQASPDEAKEARERLFVISGMLRNFHQWFEHFIVNGKFAENQLEEMIRVEKSQKRRV